MKKGWNILALLIIAHANSGNAQKIIERQIKYPNYTGTIQGFDNTGHFLAHGKTQSYNSSTKMETTGLFYKGLPDQQWVQTIDGKPVVKVNYKRGQLHGTTTKYYNNGKIASIENYSNGKLHGAATFFDRVGNILAEMEWGNGEIIMYKGKKSDKEKTKGYDCRDEGYVTIEGTKERIKYRGFCVFMDNSMRCFSPCDLFKQGVKEGVPPDRIIDFFRAHGEDLFSKKVEGFENALVLCAGKPSAISVAPNAADRITSVSAASQSLTLNKLSDQALARCTNQSTSTPGPDPTGQQQRDKALKDAANKLAEECKDESRVNPVAQIVVSPGTVWTFFEALDMALGIGGAAWNGATAAMDDKIDNYDDGDVYMDSNRNKYVILENDQQNLKYYVSENVNGGTTTVKVKYKSSKCDCEIEQTDTYDTETGEKLSSTSVPTTLSVEGSMPSNWEPKDTRPALNIANHKKNELKNNEKKKPDTGTPSHPDPAINPVDPEMTASSCQSLKAFVGYCNSQDWRDPKCIEFLRALDRCPPGNSNTINPGPDGTVRISCSSGQMNDEQRAEQECKRLGMVAIPVSDGKLDCKPKEDVDLISKAKSRLGPCGPEMQPRPGQPCEPHKKVPRTLSASANSSQNQQNKRTSSVTQSSQKLPGNDSINLLSNTNPELSKLNLYEEEFDNKVKGSKVAVIMFYQASSNAANKMIPILEKIQSESGQKGYSIYIINSDENPSLTTKNNIAYSPSFMFFRDGKKTDELIIGALSQKDLSNKINKLF